MQLTGVKPDDIVRCDVRGQKFWALVIKPDTDQVRGKGLRIRELDPRHHLPTLFVTGKQVIGIWRKRGKSTVDV